MIELNARAMVRWGGAVTAVLALLLALLLATGANQTVFLAVNGQAWPGEAWFWSNVTVLGDTITLLVLLLPFIGRRPDLVWVIMVAVVVVSAGVHGAKLIYNTPRPPAVLPPDLIQVIGFRATTASFPSGHSAAAFAFAGGICLSWFPTSAKVAALTVAVLIGISRMAVGAHWPVDVLGGAIIGWCGVVIAHWLAARWPHGMRRGVQRGAALTLLVVVAFTLWNFDGGYPLGRPLLVLLALAALAGSWSGLRALFGRGS